MTETPNIAAALSAFQADMPPIVKSKTARIKTQSGDVYTYTYADLAAVTAQAAPLLHEHGLAFTACPTRTEQGSYELVGMLLHTSGESLRGSLPLNGHKAQEIGSSITYARRYLLGAMTGIVTDDDDDGAAGNDAPPVEAKITAKTRRDIEALFGRKGIPDDQQVPGIVRITGKPYAKLADLTQADAATVIRTLELRPDATEQVAELQTPRATGAEPVPVPVSGPPAGDGEGEAPEPAGEPVAEVGGRGPRMSTRAQHKMIHGLLGGLNGPEKMPDQDRYDIASAISHQRISSFNELTHASASAVIEALQKTKTRADLDQLLGDLSRAQAARWNAGDRS